jgi:hypothetical protein
MDNGTVLLLELSGRWTIAVRHAIAAMGASDPEHFTMTIPIIT